MTLNNPENIKHIADELMVRLAPHIEDVIQSKVNGKVEQIKAINEKQNDILTKMSTEISLIKEQTKPIVELYNNTSGFSATVVKISKFVIGTGATLAAIYWFKDKLHL